jgi:dTDP-glucose 4,6-dehydratase
MREKIVVLGSNSFSGASFVSFLIRRSEVEKVVGISRSEEPDSVFLPYRKDTKNQKKFDFYKVDLNSEVDNAIDIITKFEPQYIVNFAAQGMVAQSWENPDQWINTNVVSLAKLLKGIHKVDSIKGFVQASTPEVYGPSNNMTESQCFSPSTPYAASKASADLLLYTYYKTHKFPIKYTRSANIYGPSQQLYRIIPKTILSIMNSTRVPLHGGGRSVRSFIHIDDVSRATYLVMKSGKCGDAYHISGDKYVSIRELINEICLLMNVRINEIIIDADRRVGNDPKYSMNSSKIRNEFGWTPLVDLHDGISQTIRWAKDNNNVLKCLTMEYIHKE